MLTSLIFLFIKISIEKFGKNNFLKMLLGTYKKPKEEARIFMFLDLKNSTGIAEQLGHFKYSEFIQECFYDLNSVVSKYDAEIYQYVGDEAVITWNLKKEKANNNCIMLFFAFEEQISSRVKLYKNKFGIIPEFKAGVHAGKLIVVEVGTLKKELAYHGDVINTAARIQSLCNSYNQRLIVSEFLLNRIKLHNLINSTQLGEIALKGKKEKINLFGISH
jgi:adenylate cyclase